MILRDFIPEYEKHHVRRKKPSTQIAHRQILNKSILPVLGAMELTDIRRRDVGDLIVWCEDRGLTAKTINDHLSVLSQVLKCAIRRDLIEFLIPIERLAMDTKPDIKFLESAQVNRLAEACADPIVRAMIKFAVKTGLRIGELRALEWKHIDLDLNVVRVQQTCFGRLSDIGSVKGSESRSVPLTHGAKDIVKSITRTSRFVFGAALTGDSVALPLSYKTCHEGGIVKAAKLAGLYRPEFGFHTLRHTYASHLARSGVDIFKIRDWLGHVDIQITMRYAHLKPDSGHEQVALLDDLFD